MKGFLDIAPLRSLVAVADCGGFQRAAASLHLSQAAVSQHVRRLERTLGRVLIRRQGRGSRFTADGEVLLRQARLILALHDETLRGFGVDLTQSLLIGSTEHAAAQLLPELAGVLGGALPECQVRFRIDRGVELRSGIADGRIDLALLLGPADQSESFVVGELELTWYSAPDWTAPRRGEPISLVAFDAPCALRTRALETLAAHHYPAQLGCEAANLAGVHAAVRAGLGVGLMATLGQTPEHLVARDDLPPVTPIELSVLPRRGLPSALIVDTVAALRGVLTLATSSRRTRPQAA